MTTQNKIADLIDGASVARVTLTNAVDTAQGARLVAAFLGPRLLFHMSSRAVLGSGLDHGRASN
jgi:predicted RNA-binding protein with EMAP domain